MKPNATGTMYPLTGIAAILVVVLAAMAGLFPPIQDYKAMAQPAPLYIVVVDFDVDLRHRQEFLGAILEDGAAAMREPGGREFHVASSEQNLTHVFVFAAYDNAAAWDAHQKTVHYGNFIKTTSAAVKTYDFRPFSSVAMNTKGTTLSGHFFINVAYLDIDQADFDKFMDAARENATASVKDPGCQEFNIAVSQQHPYQVLFFEVFYAAAAFDAYERTEHFKKFQAMTSNMIVNRNETKLQAIAMYWKSM